MTRTSFLFSAALLAAPAVTLANDTNDLTVFAVTNPDMVVSGLRMRDVGTTNAVVDALRGNPYLSGRIGVETVDGVVKLNGVLATPSQARSALRTVTAVNGVRQVEPELRTRVFTSY